MKKVIRRNIFIVADFTRNCCHTENGSTVTPKVKTTMVSIVTITTRIESEGEWRQNSIWRHGQYET